jgi:hypothetical protein
MTTDGGFLGFGRPGQKMTKTSLYAFRNPSADQFDGRLLRVEQRLAELQRSNRR